MSPQKLFFAQPLLAVSSTPDTEERYRKFYMQIVSACRQRKFSVYDPYEDGHPVKHEFATDKVIYETTREQIYNSEIVIAYVGLPSAGVATGIAIANSLGLPVILLYEDGRRDQVSKMVRGCPAARFHILAPDLEGLAVKFESQFNTILEQLSNTHTTSLTSEMEPFTDKLNQFREQSGISYDQIAQRTELDKPYVWRVFKGDVHKPGRNQVIKLCAWGLQLSLEQTNTVLRSGGYQPL